MRARLLTSLSLWMVLGLSASCGGADEREAPVRALLSFLSALERGTHEPEFREQAYMWIDEASRDELQRRASLARSLAGRELEPWEMLTPGRLTVASRELRRRALRAKIDGDRATIALGEGKPIELVREEGQWHVRLLDDVAPAP